jgi:hypothetical protein
MAPRLVDLLVEHFHEGLPPQALAGRRLIGAQDALCPKT